MKTILTLSFCLVAFWATCQITYDTIKPDIDFYDDLIPKYAFGESIDLPIDTAITGGAMTEIIGYAIQGDSWSLFSRDYDCEPWTSYTEWQDKNKVKGCGLHNWVYAEWQDVNTSSGWVTADIPPPCGRTTHSNEARICSICALHQTRVQTSGAKAIPRKSEYKKLLEKSKN